MAAQMKCARRHTWLTRMACPNILPRALRQRIACFYTGAASQSAHKIVGDETQLSKTSSLPSRSARVPPPYTFPMQFSRPSRIARATPMNSEARPCKCRIIHRGNDLGGWGLGHASHLLCLTGLSSMPCNPNVYEIRYTRA